MTGLRELMLYGKAMVQQFEIGKYVSLFRMSLRVFRVQLLFLGRLQQSSNIFLRLGFIRSETSAGLLGRMSRPSTKTPFTRYGLLQKGSPLPTTQGLPRCLPQGEPSVRKEGRSSSASRGGA